MLRTGVLNPQILSLVARVRHTNTLVVADRGFPSWPGLETIDISLVDDVPTVLQVVQALVAVARYGQAYMAEEFLRENGQAKVEAVRRALGATPLTFEPHEAVFKKRVPAAIGLIRTGDTTQYANLILQSA
jgi:D-ribose pyranase